MNAWRRWRRLWKALGASGSPRPLFHDLETRYGEPGRAYHTFRHIGSCLAELDRVRHLCARPLAVELAIWFHDAVYDPRSSGNEARSAEILREAALRAGMDRALSAEAEDLVLATAHLAGEPGKAGAGFPVDADLMRDIDLAILGRPRRRFDAYERAVRREYGHLSEAEWKAGRTRVLDSFLGRPALFSTAELRGRYEARARENLARSRAVLTAPAAAPPASRPPR